MESEATGSGPDQQSEKRKGTDEEESTTAAPNSRKQQNHSLLFNAMRTTAVHASTTFTTNTRPVVDQTPTTEGVPPETTVERARSASMAATPAPPTRRSSTPRVIQSPDPAKGLPGAPGVPQKKKKKRECLSGVLRALPDLHSYDYRHKYCWQYSCPGLGTDFRFLIVQLL